MCASGFLIHCSKGIERPSFKFSQVKRKLEQTNNNLFIFSLAEEKVRQLQREVTALEEEYKAALQNKKLYWPSVVRPTYLVEDDDSYSEEYYRINNDTPSGRLDRAILAANYNVLQDHKASDLQRIDAFINER